MKIVIAVNKGGRGSGNYGHKGRPGQVGGSIPVGVQMSLLEEAIIYRPSLFEKLKDNLSWTFDYDKDLITYGGYDYSGEGYKFEVGGEEFTAAADYDPKTRVIRLFDGALTGIAEGEMPNINITSVGANGGVIAHEVMHDKWNTFYKASEIQYNDFKKRVESDKKKGINPGDEDSFLDNNRGLKYEEDRRKYRAMDLYARMIRNADYFERTDGITDYSRSYWKDYSKDKSTYALHRPMDETLAEIAKVSWLYSFRDIDAKWHELYSDIRYVAKTYEDNGFDFLAADAQGVGYSYEH